MIIGLDGKLHFGTAGATVTPIDGTTEVKNARDVTIHLEWGETDATCRGSGRKDEIEITSQNHHIEFDLVNNRADADVIALKNAHLNGTLIALLALDEETGEGPDGDYYITGFTRGEPMKEGQTFKVVAKPSSKNRVWTWYEPS